MIRRGLSVVCMTGLLLTGASGALQKDRASRKTSAPKSLAASATIDVSAPLNDVFFTQTSMGIASGVDAQGNPIYTATVPVPYYEQANVIWQLSFDQVQFDSLGSAVNQQNYSNLQQIQAAISSGSLTSLAVRFLDNLNGEVTFTGYAAGITDPVALDRTGAMDTLLTPVQNLSGSTVLFAVAFVSASSLGLTDVPMFLDGRIDSAFDPPPQMATSTAAPAAPRSGQPQQQTQPAQQQQLAWAGCNAAAGCTVPPGTVCAVIRWVNQFYIDCNGTVTGPFSQRPLNIQAGCTIRIAGQQQWVPGACNWVGLFRRWRRCLCR